MDRILVFGGWGIEMSDKCFNVYDKKGFNKLLKELMDWNDEFIPEGSFIRISTQENNFPGKVYFKEILSDERQRQKNDYVKKIESGKTTRYEINSQGNEIMEHIIVVGGMGCTEKVGEEEKS